ncbi:hypothetical protein FISHEDRAFT_73689 [Fistulina hepatica ATCC 64428]|uniref:WW domain-containing protein n=1 Tax=Fistulina hepatica ATCC 64428 TaxID=1128425 RepID=A0A0D7ACB7_9AGAR|nr:hypothetical protein FISHEDRAFT_73689 [Fistulina hepatica ATCC 64428]
MDDDSEVLDWSDDDHSVLMKAQPPEDDTVSLGDDDDEREFYTFSKHTGVAPPTEKNDASGTLASPNSAPDSSFENAVRVPSRTASRASHVDQAETSPQIRDTTPLPTSRTSPRREQASPGGSASMSVSKIPGLPEKPVAASIHAFMNTPSSDRERGNKKSGGGAPPAEDPLPSGWETRRSKSNANDVYYYNPRSGETTWDRPTAGKRDLSYSDRHYRPDDVADDNKPSREDDFANASKRVRDRDRATAFNGQRDLRGETGSADVRWAYDSRLDSSHVAPGSRQRSSSPGPSPRDGADASRSRRGRREHEPSFLSEANSYKGVNSPGGRHWSPELPEIDRTREPHKYGRGQEDSAREFQTRKQDNGWSRSERQDYVNNNDIPLRNVFNSNFPTSHPARSARRDSPDRAPPDAQTSLTTPSTLSEYSSSFMCIPTSSLCLATVMHGTAGTAVSTSLDCVYTGAVLLLGQPSRVTCNPRIPCAVHMILTSSLCTTAIASAFCLVSRCYSVNESVRLPWLFLSFVASPVRVFDAAGYRSSSPPANRFPIHAIHQFDDPDSAFTPPLPPLPPGAANKRDRPSRFDRPGPLPPVSAYVGPLRDARSRTPPPVNDTPREQRVDDGPSSSHASPPPFETQPRQSTTRDRPNEGVHETWSNTLLPPSGDRMLPQMSHQPDARPVQRRQPLPPQDQRFRESSRNKGRRPPVLDLGNEPLSATLRPTAMGSKTAAPISIRDPLPPMPVGPRTSVAPQTTSMQLPEVDRYRPPHPSRGQSDFLPPPRTDVRPPGTQNDRGPPLPPHGVRREPEQPNVSPDMIRDTTTLPKAPRAWKTFEPSSERQPPPHMPRRGDSGSDGPVPDWRQGDQQEFNRVRPLSSGRAQLSGANNVPLRQGASKFSPSMDRTQPSPEYLERLGDGTERPWGTGRANGTLDARYADKSFQQGVMEFAHRLPKEGVDLSPMPSMPVSYPPPGYAGATYHPASLPYNDRSNYERGSHTVGEPDAGRRWVPGRSGDRNGGPARDRRGKRVESHPPPTLHGAMVDALPQGPEDKAPSIVVPRPHDLPENPMNRLSSRASEVTARRVPEMHPDRLKLLENGEAASPQMNGFKKTGLQFGKGMSLLDRITSTGETQVPQKRERESDFNGVPDAFETERRNPNKRRNTRRRRGGTGTGMAASQ